jgi:hypothetical protein
MALDTLTGLKAAIADYLGQDNLTSRIPSFIDIAESRINARLNVRRMETSGTLTTTAGVDYVTLPDAFRGMRAVYVDGDPQYTLEYLSPEQLNNVANTSGRPKFYTIRANRMVFPGTADAAYEVQIHYIARFAALTASAESNWLTEEKPETYLYGALQAACEFTGDDEAAARYGMLFDKALAELQARDDKEKYGPVPVMKTEGARW